MQMLLLIDRAIGDRRHACDVHEHRDQRNGARVRCHQLGRDGNDDSEEAKRKSELLLRRQPLTHQKGRSHRRHQRLQRRDQPGDTGWHAMRNAPPHATEIDPVQEDPTDGRMQGRRPTAQPSGAADKTDTVEHDDSQCETDDEKQKRAGVKRAELGDNPAGRPEDHEDAGNESIDHDEALSWG